MIRFAKETDLPKICEIRRQVHKIHVDGRPDIYCMPENAEEFDQLLADDFSKENYRLMVCEADAKITAYALIRLVRIAGLCMKKDRYSYYIDEFGVDASCRRQGFGTELMDGIIAAAKRDNASAVELAYWAFNETAAAFYQNLGMTPMHTLLELPL